MYLLVQYSIISWQSFDSKSQSSSKAVVWCFYNQWYNLSAFLNLAHPSLEGVIRDLKPWHCIAERKPWINSLVYISVGHHPQEPLQRTVELKVIDNHTVTGSCVFCAPLDQCNSRHIGQVSTCRPMLDRYVSRYVDQHISVNISVDTRLICRPTYRSTLDWYIGRHLTDMSTDTSVESRSICQPICIGRGVHKILMIPVTLFCSEDYLILTIDLLIISDHPQCWISRSCINHILQYVAIVQRYIVPS